MAALIHAVLKQASRLPSSLNDVEEQPSEEEGFSLSLPPSYPGGVPGDSGDSGNDGDVAAVAVVEVVVVAPLPSQRDTA